MPDIICASGVAFDLPFGSNIVASGFNHKASLRPQCFFFGFVCADVVLAEGAALGLP